VYPDFIGSVNVSVTLTQESRNWILSDLAQVYPGAYLHRPGFSFSFVEPGNIAGNQTVSWERVIEAIQVEDPGYYTVSVNGVTQGTPVSDPRYFGGGLGQFAVSLLRVTLSQP